MVKEPKPAPPVPETGVARGFVGIPSDVVPVTPYDPDVASGKVGPPSPTPSTEPTSTPQQEARDVRVLASRQRVVTAQEQKFNVDLQRQEVDAREQFQRDLIVGKARAYERWHYGFGHYGDTVGVGVGLGQEEWNVEYNKFEAGQASDFEAALGLWKADRRAAFGKYKSDVLASDLYSVRQVIGEPLLRGVGSYKFARGKGDTLKTELVPKTPLFGIDYDIRDVSRWAKTQSTPSFGEPTFGKDYDILEVSRWAKTQPSREAVFGVDYTTKDVARWAKQQQQRKSDVLVFQGVPHKADVSWDVDVKVAHTQPFGSLENPESYYSPAVLGRDYSMLDVARFAKTLTSKPVFGKDYTMKDVSAWAKKQAGPVFGVDYTMHDVARWAKTQTSIGQAAKMDQAAYEAKQTKSREFYTKIGYPQYGGKYEPFDVSMFPQGYDLNISETAEGLRIEPNIPKSITQQVAEGRGGFFSNWLSGVLGFSKQPGNAAASRASDLFNAQLNMGKINLNPIAAEFIAPFESAGLTVLKLAGVQGLQNAPTTALSSFLGSINYGKQPSGAGLSGLISRMLGYGGNIRASRAMELFHEMVTPETLYLKPGPELLGYLARPDLLLASLLGEAALFYTETKAIQGVGKLAHSVYGHTIKGSGLEQRLVNWAWKDPALSGFEKAGLEQVPNMDTSYLKSSSFITGYEQNTGLSSGLRGLIRGRLPLSELTVGLPTLPGYVPGAAEEALVKGSVGLGGYDMKWLPRLQAGLEFGDMMTSPGAAGFGLTVPAPLAAVGVSNVGRVYAFELMAMPSGFASGFARSSADKWANVGFIDDSSKYDLSMSKGGRFFKESMPSDYLAGFTRGNLPLLEIGRGSLGVREFAGSSEYGFMKSGKSLSDLGLVSLSRETFMPMVETMRLSYLPLSGSQLAGRAFLKLGSYSALSLTFGKTVVQAWNMPSVSLPLYMQRTSMLSKTLQQQQRYMEETQYLSYPGVDVGYQQVLKPSQMFKESNMLFDLQRSRFVSDWTQKQEQKPKLGILSSYSFKPYLKMASLFELPQASKTLPSLPRLDYGVQSSKSCFLFGLSGFGLGLGASTGSREIMRSVEAQTQKLYAGQRQLQLQVPKTLVLIKPAAEVGFPPQHPFFEDVGYKKRKQRKTRMTKEYPFGKFLRVTPVMTAKQYRKLMLG